MVTSVEGSESTYEHKQCCDQLAVFFPLEHWGKEFMTCTEVCKVYRYFLDNNLRDIIIQNLSAKCTWPLLIYAFISEVCISMNA